VRRKLTLRTVAVAARRVDFVLVLPFDRDERPRHRRGGFRTNRLFDELDAILDQEVESREVLVGKDAYQVTVAVARDRRVVAHPVLEDLVRRILDAGLLLQGVAAAEMDASAAQHAAAADVEVLLHADHGGAAVARRDGGGEARYAGPDDDHVGRQVPFDGLRLGLVGAGAGESGSADTGRALRQEGAPAHFVRTLAGAAIVCVLAHLLLLPLRDCCWGNP
jgi:hypothetical protein